MACAHPFLYVPDKDKNNKPYWANFTRFYYPCGWCLNCRVDKQNQLTDRCEEELINYRCGAFVTVTYDDYHIINKLRINSSGELEATLSKSDGKKFIDRLRANIKRNLPDNILSNHHFKYLVVGEYGGDGQIFDRPHMHFLFFGLDFAYCKKEFEKAWQGQGIIECDPILQGGIRYVLKYLDKQLFGKQAEDKYDKNNLERPFQSHSLGLGSTLFNRQKDYIKKTNGMYRWKGKDKPVPPYYKNKYLIATDRKRQYQEKINKYQLYNGFGKIPNQYDLHNFQITKALLREENINQKLFQHGRPRFDWMSITEKQTLSESYINELVNYAFNSQVPF